MVTPRKYTAFRCPQDLLAKAKAKASADQRSLSNYLIMLIAKDVKSFKMPGRKKSRTESAKPAKKTASRKKR